MKSAGIILIYDITNSQSFKDVENWIDDIECHSEGKNYKILVGNQCDLVSKRVISTEMGQILADKYGYSFIET